MTTARRVAAVAAGLGAAVVIGTTLAGATLEAVGPVLGFTVWALLPYALLLLAGRLISNPWPIGGAGALALAAECGIRASVFLFPRGSTAALALIFSPALITSVCLPAGAAAGWIVGHLWTRSRAVGHIALAAATALILAFVWLGFARPDLMPTEVFRRRTALARTGKPRVVAGADAFQRRTVWNQSAWYLSGSFTGQAGDDIAIVGVDRIHMLDPEDGRVRQDVAIAPSIRQKWNWNSTLVHVNGRLMLAQTGGGFQDTEVWELDGGLLWRYRPDPALPPTAMKAADLDGDGRSEFYISDARGVARLDEAGREVWRRDKPLAHLIAVLPKTGRAGARIVAYRYPSPLSMWDEKGENASDLKRDGDGRILGAISWQGEHMLLFGGGALRAVGLDGTARFEVPFGDFSVVEALPVTLAAGEPASLALTGSAGRGVDRSRLLLLSATREVRFDEVLGAPVRLLKARHADGRETLLVAGAKLEALEPKRPPQD